MGVDVKSTSLVMLSRTTSCACSPRRINPSVACFCAAAVVTVHSDAKPRPSAVTRVTGVSAVGHAPKSIFSSVSVLPTVSARAGHCGAAPTPRIPADATTATEGAGSTCINAAHIASLPWIQPLSGSANANKAASTPLAR